MSKICEVCFKAPVAGRTITRKGLAKKKGGVGRKVVRVNPRRFFPNLQRIKALVNGTVKHILVCTKCLKTGRVTKAG